MSDVTYCLEDYLMDECHTYRSYMYAYINKWRNMVLRSFAYINKWRNSETHYRFIIISSFYLISSLYLSMCHDMCFYVEYVS